MVGKSGVEGFVWICDFDWKLKKYMETGESYFVFIKYRRDQYLMTHRRYSNRVLSRSKPVLHDWCKKGRAMCYPVSGIKLYVEYIRKQVISLMYTHTHTSRSLWSISGNR